MLDDFEFDPTDNAYDAPVKSSYEPIPKGEYRLKSTDAKWRALKNDMGWVIDVKFEILDGQHAGRTVQDSLAVQHTTNADWVKTSLNKLAQMMRSMELKLKLDSKNTDELIGRECIAEIGQKKGTSDGYINYWFDYKPAQTFSATGNDTPF